MQLPIWQNFTIQAYAKYLRCHTCVDALHVHSVDKLNTFDPQKVCQYALHYFQYLR